MDDLTLARAFHVAAIAHWIGGVSFVTLAELSGFYMTHRLAAWGRFVDPGFWWMHSMVTAWLVFALVLFVFEPLVLRRWFAERAQRAPEGTMALVWRGHLVLLTLSLVTVNASVLGAHSAQY